MKQGHNYQMQQLPQQSQKDRAQSTTYGGQTQASMQEYNQESEIHPASHPFLMDIFARDKDLGRKQASRERGQDSNWKPEAMNGHNGCIDLDTGDEENETRAEEITEKEEIHLSEAEEVDISDGEEDSGTEEVFDATTIHETKESQGKYKKWTRQDDEAIRDSVNKYGAGNWEKVATVVQGTTPKQCELTKLKYISPIPWRRSEDSNLRTLVAKHGHKRKWTIISEEIKGRSATQCQKRWREIDHEKPRKTAQALSFSSAEKYQYKWSNPILGNWSAEEDAKLMKLVKIYGHHEWAIIALELWKESNIKRVGKQCRERWLNHLAPNIKKGGWTDGEDLLLEKLQKEKGNKWVEIAKCMNGRTENDVKNRFYSASKKRKQVSVVSIEKNGLSGSTKERLGREQDRRDWTFEEDEALRLAVEKNFNDDWESIAKEVPSRTEVQCYLRWHQSLKDKSEWSPEEDSIIVTLQRVKGNKWTAIARELPGRTATEVRNHFYRRSMWKTKKNSQIYKLPTEDYELKTIEKDINEKDSIINAQNMEIKRLKEQLPQKNKRNLGIDELNERLKEQLAKKNEKDSVMEALKKEIEGLKEQLAKKNEKDFIIEALTNEIEGLKDQLAKNKEKDSVIEALKKEMDKHIAKNNVKKSSGNDDATEKNAPLILKISPVTKKNTEESMNKSVQEMLAKVDVEVDPLEADPLEADPLANFPLGSKTILFGNCYNCDACKEAWFRSYDEAYYHESLCQIYRDRTTAKAALEQVNKALVKKMKSINVKKESRND